jgi:beta-galactosidase
LVFTVSKAGQVIDERFVNMGFVSYKVRKNEHLSQLYVNGKRTLIKGTTYIEDFAEGKPISYAKLERDIKRIKMNLGANLIRIKYGTPSPYLLNLCDKYGLLVLTELPLYDVPKSMYRLDEIKVKMLNLSDRYVNVFGPHPSIAAWGLFDGVDDTNINTSDYFINVFRKYSNKLIYKIVRFGTKEINTQGIDFIGLRDNRKFNSIEEIGNELTRLVQLADNLPVFVEYGYPIKPENHNGYSDPLSLEAQAYYILNLYHIVQNNKLMGNLINTYKDYYLENPMMIVDNKNLYLCSSGLVDIFGKERLAFKTTKALFTKEKEPLLNSGSFSESTPISYIIIGILFTVLIVYYINRYKRFKEYFIRAFIRPYNFFADIRDQRIISNIQTVVLAFILSLTIGLFLSSVIYFFRTDTITQLILILLIPSRFVQEFFFTIVWSPELLLLTITFFLFSLFFVFAGIIRLIALFVRSRIYYKDTLTIVVWSTVPFIILLPFSVILIKLMLFSPALTWVIFLTLGLFTLWTLYRILKAVGIVFDTHPSKTYIIGFSIIIILFIGILSIYQLQYSIFYYSEYIFQTLLS